MQLTPQERDEALGSLKRYFSEELEIELGNIQAGALLDFMLKEVGPLAYNRGVRDAEAFLRARLEDLPDTCYEQPLTHWQTRPRRK